MDELQAEYQKLLKRFVPQELVCSHVYKKYGSGSLVFLDIRLVRTVLFIREKMGLPIISNNWHKGGDFSQRGFRCNLCSLIAQPTKSGKLYLTAHGLGKALDFNVVGKTAQQVREWLDAHAGELPYPIRVEDDVTWVHIDVRRNDSSPKVYHFKA